MHCNNLLPHDSASKQCLLGSDGGVNSGGALGAEGSVGGFHSGGALGMTAWGWLPLLRGCQSSGSWLRDCRWLANPAASTCDACQVSSFQMQYQASLQQLHKGKP